MGCVKPRRMTFQIRLPPSRPCKGWSILSERGGVKEGHAISFPFLVTPGRDAESVHPNMNALLNQLTLLSGKAEILFIGLGVLLLLVLLVVVSSFGMIYVRALSSGAKVTLTELIALRLRRVPVGLVVDNRITAVRSGLLLSIDDLSTHFMAGGNVPMVVLALIAARKAGIPLSFDRACAIDLATKGTGKTLLEAVRTSINPRVIDCPASNDEKLSITGVAKDGIVIRARVRVTVRTNLDRFVGGATEETIVARVGEGIVSTIGSSATYKDVLQDPKRISKTVLEKGLDANTAFEILSLDIADLVVGENIGAKLQAEQAEANKLIAQAQAEIRRAAAVAVEQEMTARVAEMRARVVEAEVEVPLGLAAAFRAGRLGHQG